MKCQTLLSILPYQHLQVSIEGPGKGEVAAFVARHFSALSTVEVILPCFAFDDFSGLGDTNAFGDGFVRLEFHIYSLCFPSYDRRDVTSCTRRWLFDGKWINGFNALEEFFDAFIGEIAVFLFASAEHDLNA